MTSVKKEKFFALKGRGKQVHIFQVYATEKETQVIVAIITPRAVPLDVLAPNVGVKGTWVLILIGKSKSEVRKKAEMTKKLRPGQPRVECKLYKSSETARRRVCWSFDDLLKT